LPWFGFAQRNEANGSDEQRRPLAAAARANPTDMTDVSPVCEWKLAMEMAGGQVASPL
jgi:hypothetical protein